LIYFPPMAQTSTLPRRLLIVANRLVKRYGRPRHRRTDPLSDLIQTVLSQHTSDVNSGRAFRSLRETFPSWESVAEAQPQAVEKAIRVGGLARTKSRTIVRVLAAVKRREGRYDLGILRRLDPAAAAERLTGLPGVGPKTRACVLLFACGHPAFPVDTHVHRIARRLGVVPDRATAEKTHAILEPAVPPGRALDLHVNLIRLGREVCRPRGPRCPCCPLRSACRAARRSA
jgi:endonuclease-3